MKQTSIQVHHFDTVEAVCILAFDSGCMEEGGHLSVTRGALILTIKQLKCVQVVPKLLMFSCSAAEVVHLMCLASTLTSRLGKGSKVNSWASWFCTLIYCAKVYQIHFLKKTNGQHERNGKSLLAMTLLRSLKKKELIVWKDAWLALKGH